jgi:DsbC/DsbD-like thiol-disulfide interchange protein
MRSICFMMMISLSAWSAAEGRATAELLISSMSVKAGEAFSGALRMKFEEGWHGYWSNPGETGMAPEVEWKLPEGWKAGALQYPVPKFHMTGELASYVYEGEVVIPFVLTAPAVITDAQVLKCSVSWLACDEKSCVAGDAELQVTLSAGGGEARPDAEVIAKAVASMPAVVDGVTLKVEEKEGKVLLQVVADRELQGAELFPINQRVLDQTKRILLEKSSTGYEASVKKNEFASAEIAELSLLIVPKQSSRAIIVAWKK